MSRESKEKAIEHLFQRALRRMNPFDMLFPRRKSHVWRAYVRVSTPVPQAVDVRV